MFLHGFLQGPLKGKWILDIYIARGKTYFNNSIITEDLIVRYPSGFFLTIIIFCFLLDFSKTPGRIFMNFFRDGECWSERPKIIFRVMTSLPVWDIDNFLILRVSFCDAISSKTTQDIFFKFLRVIDKGRKFIQWKAQESRSKSAEARSGSKIEFFKASDFSGFFSAITFTRKYFVIHVTCRTKVV